MKKTPVNGMIPPQAVNVEEALLGMALINPSSLNEVSDTIRSEIFYRENNRLLASILLEMFHKNKSIDLLTVSEVARQRGKLDELGGDVGLLNLMQHAETGGNMAVYVSIVFQKYIAREIIRLTAEMQKKAFQQEGDPFDLIADFQEMFSKLSGFDRGNVHHISEMLTDLLAVIDRNLSGNSQITGIPTGLSMFDKFSSGLQAGDLVIIAAETSQGKSSLALNIAANAATYGNKVAIFSYEMSNRQLAARLLSEKSGVSSKAIQYYPLSDENLQQVNSGLGKLEKAEIYFDDMVSSRFDYLERSIRALVSRDRMKVIIVDYLQLIRPVETRNMNKADAIAQIANDLKSLARALNVPILLLSQLSRDRNNPFPTLSRLKGSGDIENAADIVWFIYRPEYYGYGNFDFQGNTLPARDVAQHIIAKGRNIGTFEFLSHFEAHTTRFSDYIEQTELQSSSTGPF